MSADLTALFAGNGKPNADDLDALFSTPAAEPLPAGEYVAEIVSGKLGTSKSNKPRYELRARVVEGENSGRAIFDDWYLTKEAWWKTAPFLAKLGIKSPVQCRREFPSGWLARVRLVIESHQGIARNKLADLVIVGRKPDDPPAPIGAPPIDPFSPSTTPAAAAEVTPQSEEGSRATATKSDAWEPPADRPATPEQLSFSFGANADGPYAPGGDRP